MSNQELAKKLHITKMKSTLIFIDNIWGADVADMQLISKLNKVIRFLLCVIDISSKYELVVPLKEKKKILQLLKVFKNFWMSLIVNQIKYWQMKGVNFTIDQLNYGSKIMI